MNLLRRIFRSSTDRRSGLLHEYSITEELVPAVPLELWEVRWYSRYGSFHGDTQPEIYTAHSEAEAKKFAEDLKRAHKFLRNTTNISISVKKRND